MLSALQAQLSGRFDEARRLYESVVASNPNNFDAVHMLGVVCYQQGDFDRAREFVAAAVRMRPVEAAPHKNLSLIDQARERRLVEQEVCREVLPRLAARCVAPPRQDERDCWKQAEVDVIALKRNLEGSEPELTALIRWLNPGAMTLWLTPAAKRPAERDFAVRLIGANNGAVPRRDRVVFFGADLSPGEWLSESTATDVALYCNAEPPCLLLDRIPELAREGCTPLRLLYLSVAEARRIGLPGTVVAESISDVIAVTA